MEQERMEILDAIKELAIEQAILREKVESYLKQSERVEEDVSELKKDSKMLHMHDIILKGSLWAYGLLITFGIYKLFPVKN